MSRCYAGIGSRKTPANIQQTMERIGYLLAERGWTLRTGDAEGADAAFLRGASSVTQGAEPEVFAPRSSRYPVTEAAMALARDYHPGWERCAPFVRLLHARNSYQILGPGLNDPSQFVLCWTPDGARHGGVTSSATGGTGQAIRLASAYGIPIFNLASADSLSDFAALWKTL